jgi:hypothetical protein
MVNIIIYGYRYTHGFCAGFLMATDPGIEIWTCSKTYICLPYLWVYLGDTMSHVTPVALTSPLPTTSSTTPIHCIMYVNYLSSFITDMYPQSTTFFQGGTTRTCANTLKLSNYPLLKSPTGMLPSQIHTCILSGRLTDATGCKGNLTILRRILYLDLAKGNPK